MRGLLADVVPASCVDGPGNRYVVFLQGCSFDCLACHNPHTIGRHASANTHWVEADDLVTEIGCVAPFLSGVTVSGGEATLQWQFVVALFTALRATAATRHLTRLVDSNGDAPPEVWQALAPVMEGAMVDLKAFDPLVHHRLTGRDNASVLASIRLLAALDRLTEVRLLVVPGHNDDPAQLEATAAFLTSTAAPPQVRVLAFSHRGTREVAWRFPEATVSDVEAVVARLRASGLDAEAVGAG